MLRGIGAMGVAGVVGSEMVAATEDEHECCPEGTDAWGKYEFVVEEDEDGIDCRFEFEKGEDLVDITGWDDKEGEECEPITIYYEAAEGYDVAQICAFGGNDTDTDEDPDGTYESDLENGGGRQAAISHVSFCVEEADGFGGYQIDLIHGGPIEEFDPDNGVTYNDENRLLQAYWSGDGLGDHHFHRRYDEYEHCWDEDIGGVDQSEAIPTYITVNDGTAEACVRPDDADCLDDFVLVSYGAPSGSWSDEEAPDQELWDADEDGDEDNGVVCFEVELPPVEE